MEPKYSLPRVMTVKELSAYLRVHPSTIYKLLRRGELPGFRIGTDWRFSQLVNSLPSKKLGHCIQP